MSERLYNIELTLRQLDEARASAEADGDTEAVAVIDQHFRTYLEKKDRPIRWRSSKGKLPSCNRTKYGIDLEHYARPV